MAVVIDEHVSVEPAKGGLDLGVAGELAAIGLGQTFEDRRRSSGSISSGSSS